MAELDGPVFPGCRESVTGPIANAAVRPDRLGPWRRASHGTTTPRLYSPAAIFGTRRRRTRLSRRSLRLVSQRWTGRNAGRRGFANAWPGWRYGGCSRGANRCCKKPSLPPFFLEISHDNPAKDRGAGLPGRRYGDRHARHRPRHRRGWFPRHGRPLLLSTGLRVRLLPRSGLRPMRVPGRLPVRRVRVQARYVRRCLLR